MSEAPITTPKRNILEKIFLSPNERRLRAGWRLLIHTILLLVFVTLASFVVIAPIFLLGLKSSTADDGIQMLLNELIMIIGVTGATFVARRLVDRRSIASLGLQLNVRMIYDLLAGIAITFVMMGLIFLAELALGWTTFTGFAWQSQTATAVAGGTLLWLVIFLMVGWVEELLSRGYHLQNLADGLNLFWGVLISSSIFGLMHLGNPGASWVSTLGILLAGLFLALPYVLTRQLWLSIGLHIGWNFFEGVVFGFPVSGLGTFRLLLHNVSGPELWTGGIFGPEAGLVIIPTLLIGAGLVYGYTRLNIRKTLSGQTQSD